MNENSYSVVFHGHSCGYFDNYPTALAVALFLSKCSSSLDCDYKVFNPEGRVSCVCCNGGLVPYLYDSDFTSKI